MKMGKYLLGPGGENEGIYTGDARILSKGIPDNSIDLIFTDPPWDKGSLVLYKWLACESLRILKPAGYLAMYLGNQWLARVMDYCSHLDYIRTLACVQMNSDDKAYDVRMFSLWRPVLLYRNGKGKVNSKWMPDAGYTFRDKRFHPWGQSEKPADRWIPALCPKDGIVLEPFCGGGTTLAICKMLGHRYLAFEIMPDVAELARLRVRQTQPPLPGLVLETQATLELTEES